MAIMKVVHILNTGKFSGAENVVIQIIEGLREKNDMQFVYMSLDGTIREVLQKRNIEFYLVDKISVHTIKKMVRDLKPDILHCHDYTTSILASISTNKRIISHLHNNSPWIKKYGLYSWVYWASSIKYTDILLVSETIANEYVFSKFVSKKFSVIGNPIDTRLITTQSKEFVVEKKYDIAYLGRLTEQKNPLLFIQIIKKLKAENPTISACMIGDGDLYEDVKRTICIEKLDDTIQLLGFQKNPYPFLQKSRILLATSKWEGYGLFAVEALVLGKPVVCTNVGGLKNIINSSCGYICDSTEEMVKRCSELLNNKELYADKASGTKIRVKEFITKEQYMKSILEVYEK